ncbi:nascent polypeptide-associated complex subunit alpha, muscle-specific form-like isoform X2 [Phycodurus eques]|uniref:nascent polypeptide-associated complex subunit alpha, muscle-specific form-like isoform X2 n=1 Tax=Phycodurus eques TaxID=693459 RepID=UPI002ACE301B|nr:nascent polypeptide-associated complex subunit alpha, muscle-specific form-like isoform X2 [Phycodurus eques]
MASLPFPLKRKKYMTWRKPIDICAPNEEWRRRLSMGDVDRMCDDLDFHSDRPSTLRLSESDPDLTPEPAAPSEEDPLRRAARTPSCALRVGPVRTSSPREESTAGNSARADANDEGKMLAPIVFDSEEEKNLSAIQPSSDKLDDAESPPRKFVFSSGKNGLRAQPESAQQPRVPTLEKDCEDVHGESTVESSPPPVNKDIWTFLKKGRDSGQSKAKPKTLTPSPPPELEDDFLILDDDVPFRFSIPTKPKSKQERSKKSSSDKGSSPDGGSEDHGPETHLPSRESAEEQTARKKTKKNEPAHRDAPPKKNRQRPREATADRKVGRSSGVPKSSKAGRDDPKSGRPDAKAKRRKARRHARADADPASPSDFDFGKLDPAQDSAAGRTFEQNHQSAPNESSPEAHQVLGKRKRNPPGEWWLSCLRNAEQPEPRDDRREPAEAKKGLKSTTTEKDGERAKEGKLKKKKKKKGALKNPATTDGAEDGKEQEQRGFPEQDSAPVLFSPPEFTRRDRSRKSEGHPLPQVSSKKKVSREPTPPSPTASFQQPAEKRRTRPPGEWWKAAGAPKDAEAESLRLLGPARERAGLGEETKDPRSRTPPESDGGAVGRPLARRAPRVPKSLKSSVDRFSGRPLPGNGDAAGSDDVAVRVYAPDNHGGTPDGVCPSQDIFHSGPVRMIDLEPYDDADLPSTRQPSTELSVSDLCAPPLKPFSLRAEDEADLTEWLRYLFPTTLKGKKNQNLANVSPDHFDWYFHKSRAMGVAEDLRCASFSQGKMLLGSFMKKPLWVDHSATTVFFLLTSSVSVMVDNMESCVHAGNSFMVPCAPNLAEIREAGRGGEKETWWWNLTVQEIIRGKRLAKKKWDTERTEERRKEYIEMRHRAKVEVAKAKQEA